MLKKLEEIMGTECENWFLQSRTILEFIENQVKEKQPKLLKFVIENFGIVPKSDLKIEDDKDYEGIWNSWVNKLEARSLYFIRDVKYGNHEPEEVVVMLQDNLNTIKEKDGRIVFLALFLKFGDPIIPYFKIKYPTLSENDMEKTPSSVKRKIFLMNKIFSSKNRFREWTDRLRAIMQIIDSEKNKKYRLFLLSTALMLFEEEPGNKVISMGPFPIDIIHEMLSSSEHTPLDCQNCDSLKTCPLSKAVFGSKDRCH